MPGTFPQSARSEGIVEVLLFAAAHTTDLHTRSLPSSDRGLVQSQKAHGERHDATVPRRSRHYTSLFLPGTSRTLIHFRYYYVTILLLYG